MAGQTLIETPPSATEADVLARLRLKYSETAGNGDAWAFVPHVRNAAGFNATRTADAIVMALWPSRGLVIHGFEVKVSRADWLRELKKPEKAEGFFDKVDYWWLAVSDKSIVQPGELPARWGLMVPHAKSMKVAVQAEALRPLGQEIPPVTRSFLACLLRSAAKVQAAGPVEIQEALDRQRAESAAAHAKSYERLEEERKKLDQRIRAFERAAGIQIDETGWKMHGGRTAEETGQIVRLVLSGEAQVEHAQRRLRTLARQARELADHIESQLPEEPDGDQ